MSTTAFDHYDIDCSQSPFFRKIEHLPSVTCGHLGVKCTKGKGVRVYSSGGGGGVGEEEGPHLAKRQINLILIPRLQSWTKSVKNFALSYSQETHPANLAPGWPLPPPLPGQCCLVGSKNVPATLQRCFFGGKWEVSWVNRALEGSILKLDLQGAFFLTFLSKIVGSLPAQDGRPQGQVLVSYHLTEK